MGRAIHNSKIVQATSAEDMMIQSMMSTQENVRIVVLHGDVNEHTI